MHNGYYMRGIIYLVFNIIDLLLFISYLLLFIRYLLLFYYDDLFIMCFYLFTRLPVTRWVKLSLNFELLVKKVMKFLLGQRLFNNNNFWRT